MTGIQDFLNDVDNYHRSKKNYIKENMKHLKRLEKRNKEQAVLQKKDDQRKLIYARVSRQKLHKKNPRKRRSQAMSKRSLVKTAEQPSLGQRTRSLSSVLLRPKSPQTFISRHMQALTELKNPPVACKTIACQTVKSKERIRGTIKYPTDRVHKMCMKTKDIASQTEINHVKLGSRADFKANTLPKQPVTEIKDYIKENSSFFKVNQSYSDRIRKMREKKSSPPLIPHNYQKGVLPKYLREKKPENTEIVPAKPKQKEILDERENNVRNHSSNLADQDRKELLKQMKKQYGDVVNKINQIPSRIDSSLKQRKVELQRELAKLEAGIKLFAQERHNVK